MLRVLYAVLFLCGLYFAAIAWICLLLPIGIFLPQYKYGARDLGISLAASSLAFWGYVVWLGWGWFAVRGKWTFIDSGRLAILSLLVHGGWMVLLPIMRSEGLGQFASSAWPLMAWLVANFMISVCVLIQCLGSEPIDDIAEFCSEA